VAAILAVAFAAASCAEPTTDRVANERAQGAPSPRMLNVLSLPSVTDEVPDYEFVAAPDFLNQDVGDLRTLPRWQPGDPNSWTPQLQQGISRFLDEIKAIDPDSVLVPGDLVEGHWGRDDDHTGIFGPVRTVHEKEQAIRRAANFYYSTYKHRFDIRDLTLYAALGDHDIGDNNWDDHSPATRFKRSQIGLFKQMFGRYFTHTPSGKPRFADRPAGTAWSDTAYAVHLTPDVLLVSLDEFNRRDGDVHLEVAGAQLRWLRQTLKQARADGVPWVIVQGHNPILMPVRERSTSGGHIEGGRHSALWQTMSRYGVDLYLDGEVHDTTMRQADGVTQISAGGLLYTGNASYLVAKVYDDRIDLDARRIVGSPGPRGDLWQTTGPRTRARPEFGNAPSISIGSMTLTADGRAVNQLGQLQTYDVP
jgi:3',5'-cyclic AMP phosphodiesterase CpdA